MFCLYGVVDLYLILFNGFFFCVVMVVVKFVYIFLLFNIVCIYFKKNIIGIFWILKCNDLWLIDFCVKIIILCVWSMWEKKNVDEVNKYRGCCINKFYWCKSGFFDLDLIILFFLVRW